LQRGARVLPRPRPSCAPAARRRRRVRPRYTAAKGPFIWEVIARADAWAQRTGWEPGASDA